MGDKLSEIMDVLFHPDVIDEIIGPLCKACGKFIVSEDAACRECGYVPNHSGGG